MEEKRKEVRFISVDALNDKEWDEFSKKTVKRIMRSETVKKDLCVLPRGSSVDFFKSTESENYFLELTPRITADMNSICATAEEKAEDNLMRITFL